MPPPPKNKKYPNYPKPGARSGNPMHRGGYVAPPRGGGRTPPRGGGMSAEEWARRQAEQFIQAQVDAVEEQRRIYLEELKRQAELRVQQGLRLAEALKAMGFDQRVQSLYGAAAGDIAGYAQGFSGDMRNIANADAAQAANMLSGTGQEGAVRNEGENMGNVMYGAFGYNPAHAMRESGAAYASDAAMQPAFAAQIAAYEAQQMQEKGLEGLPDFAMEIAKIRGQQPQLIQDFLDRKNAARQDAYERKRQALLDERDWWKTQQVIALQQGDAKRAAQAAQRAADAQRRLNNSSAGRDYWGNPKPGYSYGPNGQLIPPGYHWDPKKGRAVKDKSSSSKGNNTWNNLREDMANETFTVTETTPDQRVGNITVPGETKTRKMTYEEAQKMLFAKYKGRVKDKKRLLALIDEILASVGITKPADSYDKGPRGG